MDTAIKLHLYIDTGKSKTCNKNMSTNFITKKYVNL